MDRPEPVPSRKTTLRPRHAALVQSAVVLAVALAALSATLAVTLSGVGP